VRWSRNYLIHAVLALALIAVSAGWYGERSKAATDQRFESCRIDDGVLVLTYTYGANQVVSPSIDTTGDDVIVALEVEDGDGTTPAIGLSGEARFGIFGRDDERTVTYSDGESLTCRRR
jgi:hypothetical protein